MTQVNRMLIEKEIEYLFLGYDELEKGYLTSREARLLIKDLFAYFNAQLTNSALQYLIASMDHNQNGHIELAEFKQSVLNWLKLF